MNGGTWDHVPPPRPSPPAPIMIEPAWQATSPTGKVLSCAIYRVVAGFVEVRCGYGVDLIRSEVSRDIDAARAIATAWRDTARAKGFRLPE